LTNIQTSINFKQFLFQNFSDYFSRTTSVAHQWEFYSGKPSFKVRH